MIDAFVISLTNTLVKQIAKCLSCEILRTWESLQIEFHLFFRRIKREITLQDTTTTNKVTYYLLFNTSV